MRDPAKMLDRYRRIAWHYRHLPGDFGLREHTVVLLQTVFSGAQTGEAAKTETLAKLLEKDGRNPKVRWVSEEEIALGSLAAGSIKVGPITPDFSIGGTPMSSLRASTLASKGTYHLLVTGPMHPNTVKYKLIGIEGHQALHRYLVAEPVADYVAPAVVTPATPNNVQVNTADGTVQTNTADGNVQVGL
jgi:hypothetical protein